ncbi:ABC transporter ATP-binding protein [Campylobacter sp. RM15925]|uniref:metal ABC transporter ATP-binding protein n=1 Tax=Campylobacter sp. RM15925 TaxID=1705724 RepID=UPI0014763257|nr:ABC transporter ATP-binding protein [Campylobacter sp. RM15925]
MNGVKIENLSFGYDENLIFENINLSYDIKDFLAIIGPNGGGKSTLLRLMLGLLRPKSGEIKIFDKNPSEVSKTIGYVPQNIFINANFPMRVLEVVLMGRIDRKIFGFYTKEDKLEAMKALEKVGMSEFVNSRIGELSGGQRQRVYIARALCAKAKILMLDEPTASIDTKGQAAIYSLLSDINKEGIGVILISHDVNIALSFATKVAYVNHKIHMHDIAPDRSKQEFIAHLAHEHNHFCDVEIALKECGCKSLNKGQKC